MSSRPRRTTALAAVQSRLGATGPAGARGARGRARATLTRHGRRVASGTAIRNRLVLDTRGRLRAGRYTLTLRSRRGPAVRMRVTIR